MRVRAAAAKRARRRRLLENAAVLGLYARQTGEPDMKHATIAAMLAAALVAAPALADEGMWTFDNIPAAQMRQSIGFAPDQAWLDRVRLGSAKFGGGCSAAIVSVEGLIQTNQHCARACLQNLSRPGDDVGANGLSAKTRAEERQCPGLWVDVLTASSDVTAQVATATRGQTGGAFTTARNTAIASLERACKGDVADRRCQVVSLYRGGQYALYTFKRYDDVRVVFAPEGTAASFGGDPDNFNFPRYSLDVTYARLYENGQPAQTPNRLKWRSTPLTENEPVFISGSPGGTSRQMTISQLEFQRDRMLPYRLETLAETRGRLVQFRSENAEHARMALSTLLSTENSYKGIGGRRLTLSDPAVFAVKLRAETALRARLRGDRDALAAYDEVDRAMAAYRTFWLAHDLVETGPATNRLIGWARVLVRGAAEREKPEGQRLAEYSDARLPATARSLLAATPAEAPLMQLQIEFWASKLRERLTADNPIVKKVLGRESPEGLAQRLVAGTKLADPAERKRLWDGGAAAIAASTDPLIVFVRDWDADARALKTRYENEVDGPILRAQERIVKARFRLDGASFYPDATGTLRLSYGRVAGWTYAGETVAPFTRTPGLYARNTGVAPFAVHPRWLAAQGSLSPDTIFSVSVSLDVIGGNSGSPLLDRNGDVVGAVFDGNIHSLGGEYIYEGATNRAVAVTSTILEEALTKVYGRADLVAELKR